jgi:hypothetical protein
MWLLTAIYGAFGKLLLPFDTTGQSNTTRNHQDQNLLSPKAILSVDGLDSKI